MTCPSGRRATASPASRTRGLGRDNATLPGKVVAPDSDRDGEAEAELVTVIQFTVDPIRRQAWPVTGG